ncbi:glycerophosphodiester phosphodiesterase [Hymenobacter guriensis]|uniref:Glycerophosphodiester phosphodiesterase n=1 Tax=Hymenobacter guriensis TaxID=2793065 RepID=A0ABS0L3M5_9BACT|nr:glycerophosphodiester phosphodiesterase [Hymenobacter guriensis]MBG8554740.1 glycerophosphodiester phosphodiesterase [Hymenobacter guriensis]
MKQPVRGRKAILLSWLFLGSLQLAWGQNAMPLSVSQVQVIGHAGSGFFTPINPFNSSPPSSWRGIVRALQRGADGVEIDVQLSQDSIPLLYHNPNLSSMTSAATGCISTTPAAAVLALRYRGGWPYDWLQRERPQRLDTVLARLARRPVFPILHLDLHESDDCTPYGDGTRSRTLARALRALLSHYAIPPQRLLILTNQPATLRYLRQLLPGVPLGLEVTENVDAGLEQAQELGVEAVVLAKRVVTPDRSAAVHRAGRLLVIFGGRSPQAIRRLLGCLPDALEVDNVRQLLRLRRQALRQLER